MNKKIFVVLSLAVVALVGGLAIFIAQNSTNTKSRAEKTVTLSFSPSSSSTTPVQVSSGNSVALDVLLNPGTNLVKTVRVHLLYDTAKLQIADGIPFTVNQSSFSSVKEGPLYTPGEVIFTVSVGSDPSKAIKTSTTIGTIRFKAIAGVTTSEGPTLVSFASDSSAQSISSSSSEENVIVGTVPATIAINDAGAEVPTTPTTNTTTNTLVIPTIKCTLKSQICQPMYVTSFETSSTVKVNFKLGSVLGAITSNNFYGKDRDRHGRNGKINPLPAIKPSSKCSTVRMHFYVDGVKKYTSNWLGLTSLETGTIDLGPVSSGVHILGVQAEGNNPSGCNSWSGTVNLTTSSIIAVPPAPSGVCSAKAPVDSMLVMDVSGSMNDRILKSSRKLQLAKDAANRFVSIVSSDARNKVGLVSYNYKATLQSPLTNNFPSLTSRVNSLSAAGATCIQCGINKAKQEFVTDGRAGYKKVVILLTDGRANQIEGGPNRNGNTTKAEVAALTAAKDDYAANKTVYYTIGLGKDVNSSFLKQIATLTGGRYYYSPTGSDLNDIYQQISAVITQGSITGYVYNDLNNDGHFTDGEPHLAGRRVQLISGSTIVQTATTDESGAYSVSGICGGTYTLKQILESGWTQTQPAGGLPYTITISNANALVNQNFGTYQSITPTPTAAPTVLPTDEPEPTDEPTSTPAPTGIGGGPTNTPIPTTVPTDVPTATTAPTVEPTLTTVPTKVPSATPTLPITPGNSTVINLNLFLHGIGQSGDNTNLTSYSLSNQNPLHPAQNAAVSIFDASNNLITSTSGTVTFDSTSGSFKGAIDLGSAITTGVYTVKVKTDRHLYRLIAGIQTLTAGQANTLPTTDIIAGDSNDDNKLNILDYNALINCYSDLAPAVACNDTLKLQTDFNDDGNVNQVDYNLFLREIATQPGQ